MFLFMGRLSFFILILFIYLIYYCQITMNTKLKRRQNLSSTYFRILKQLQENSSKAYSNIFSRVESLIASMNIGDQLQEFSKRQESIVWYQQAKLSLIFAKDINNYQIGIKFIHWLLQKVNKSKELRLTEFPSIIEELISLLKEQKYPNEIIPYIYIISSSFVEIFVRFQQNNYIKDRIQKRLNPKYICFPFNLGQMQSDYTQRQQFWAFLREIPLLKLRNFISDENYELYNQNFMADIIDKNCILSTNLINQASFPLFQRFIISKFITFNIDKSIKITTNNYFLNKFQEITLQKLLSNDGINKELLSKEFCLTASIHNHTLTKVISFFYLMPPQLSPFSKYSIFPYQISNFSNIFFRIATQCYWEYCPKSQFLEVYYLSNQSEVQWLCIPSNIYKQFKHKISSWNQPQFQYAFGQTSQNYRGIQRKGQLVIIQTGYEYFWKVKLGSAAFLKWSLLVKQPQFIESYTDIIAEHEHEPLKRAWRIQFPHRSMIINYLSNQWMHLETSTLKKLIDLVQVRLQLQQFKYVSLIEIGSDYAQLKQLFIEKSLRLCGYCGQEIFNYFILANKQIYCLDCNSSISKFKQYQSIRYCYIHKPDKFRNYFNQLLFSKQKISNQIALDELASAEILNLSGNFYLAPEIKNSCLQKDNPLTNQPITNQFNFKKEDLSLLLFQKISSFYSPQPLFKHFVLKRIQDQSQEPQIAQLLKIMAKLILCKDEKQCLQRQICQFHQQKNYVLAGLNALRNSMR